jgi:twitching motility protein PilT
MDFRKILEEMIERRASDLHLKVGSHPSLRIDGTLYPMELEPLSPKDLDGIVAQVLTPEQKEEFEHHREIDFAFGIPGLARFRSNFYYQRGTIAMAIRHVPLGVPAIEDLNLPAIVEQLALRPRGLVLVTGTVGSGKSTTLAAMIDSINRRLARNIVTIEDPVEFLHRDDKSLISQREVSLDTESFSDALRHILRQDPDVILLGEIRDVDTMSIALMAADTGHLVLSTLHTVDAAQTVNRIISFYPPHQHDEVRFLLANTLQAVISLRLIPRSNGKGRVPAVEVMVATPTIQEYLLDSEKTMQIKAAIHEGVSQYGMQTFDQSLMKLYRDGLITLEDAIRASTSPTEFELRIRGIQSSSDSKWALFEGTAEVEGKGRKPGGPHEGDAHPPGQGRY